MISDFAYRVYEERGERERERGEKEREGNRRTYVYVPRKLPRVYLGIVIAFPLLVQRNRVFRVESWNRRVSGGVARSRQNRM